MITELVPHQAAQVGRRVGWLGRAVVGVMALLAGCGALTVDVIWDGERMNGVSPAHFFGFVAVGPLIEIRGAPPGGAPPEEVAAALRMPGRFPQVPFRLVARDADGDADEASDALRIVLAFGGGPSASGTALCKGEAGGASVQPRSDGLAVTAALCDGPLVDSSARLHYPAAIGPGDAAFTAVMARLLETIAPRDPAFRRGGGSCLFLPC